MEEWPKIYLLNQLDFKKLYQQRKSDVKGVPSPACTMLDRKEGKLAINAIAFDKSFLPAEKDEEFLACLIEHELSEVEFYLKNPEQYKRALEDVKKGRPADSEAHLFALGEEMKKADQLGILDEYCEYWKTWLKQESEKLIDEAAKTAVEERLAWRDQAFRKLKSEKEQSKEIKLR